MALAELVHERRGTGDPIVLIHGIGHRRQIWDPIVDKLAQNHEVITIDLSGFGESPAYPAGTAYDMDNACRDLAGNFAEWGLDKPHVVGNSLGGAIALELAARGHVASATGLSPAGFFGRFDRFLALFLLLVLWLTAHAPDKVLRMVSNVPFTRRLPGYLLYAHPERISAESMYGDAVGMKNAKAFLPTLRSGLTYEFETSYVPVPVTVAWGTKDRLLPYAQSARAKRILPGAKHVPLPDCGHVPLIDNPDLIVQVIEETVGRAEENPAA